MNQGQPTGEVYPTNYAITITGFLGHDNKLFDRTCPNCGGMYSSHHVSTCTKCGQPLTYITTGSGKPMSISEGTIYPSFTEKEKKRQAEAIANRKNGMDFIYRFKVFNFADDQGVLSPPKNHHLLKSGAQIKITIINHAIIPSWFLSGEGETKKAKVELMMPIYPQYGDNVKILRMPNTTREDEVITVDESMKPVTEGLDVIQNEINRLEAMIELRRREAGLPPKSSHPAQTVNQTVVNTTTTASGEGIDPFASAI